MLYDRVARNVRKSWALVGIFILLIAAIGWVFGELTGFGITHDWAVYDGDHVNRIAKRFDEVVLPFFAEHLEMGD